MVQGLMADSRTKAKTVHPDVGGTEEQMAALNEAYEVLSDEGKSTGHRTCF